MPNDCSNYLYLANGKNIFPLLDEYMQDNSPTELDFEKILPMPDTIKESCNFATPKNITKIHNAVGEEKKALERFIELNKMINLKEYGVEGWYQWCVGNWGTKWNAYDGTSNESCVMFCTAWAPHSLSSNDLQNLLEKLLFLIILKKARDSAAAIPQVQKTIMMSITTT